MKYRIQFVGKPIGSSGVSLPMTKEIEADSKAAAEAKLYDTHEHIVVTKTTEVT